MKEFKEERRAHPRIKKSLPLKIAKKDFDIITQTKNLSASGAYCPVSKFIPEMSKLEVTLILPKKKGVVKSKPCKIKCEAVVVRVEESTGGEGSSKYNIAIFFSRISKRDRQRISKYVDYCITTQQED